MFWYKSAILFFNKPLYFRTALYLQNKYEDIVHAPHPVILY